MASFNAHKILEDLYTTIRNLSTSSSQADFAKFGDFFSSDCTTYIKNMLEHDKPSKGRENTIMKLREIMTEKHWQVAEREVLSSSITADGSRIFCETKKRLLICGQPVDPFYETEVVGFDDVGLIKEMRLYSCWSPIVSVIQQVTGKGPYAVADYKAISDN